MPDKICDVDAFQQCLFEWRGGSARFNAYRSDQGRLCLALTHPTARQGPVGLNFLVCTYVAGPTSWHAVDLIVREAPLEDGSPGYEVRDTVAGFVVRFTSAHLHGDEPAALPERP